MCLYFGKLKASVCSCIDFESKQCWTDIMLMLMEFTRSYNVWAVQTREEPKGNAYGDTHIPNFLIPTHNCMLALGVYTR